MYSGTFSVRITEFPLYHTRPVVCVEAVQNACRHNYDSEMAIWKVLQTITVQSTAGN